jgi:hypothetical protein
MSDGEALRLNDEARKALDEVFGSKLAGISQQVRDLAEQVGSVATDVAELKCSSETFQEEARRMLEGALRLLTPEGQQGRALELAAKDAVVLAARRARMMKAGSGTMLQLADALDQLDLVQEGTDPGIHPPSVPTIPLDQSETA